VGCIWSVGIKSVSLVHVPTLDTLKLRVWAFFVGQHS
jgi:hypothetical protein